MVRHIRVCLVALLLGLACADGHAAVLRVAAGPVAWPLPYSSVQAAINAAAPGDEVWVASGAYRERITLKEGVSLYGGFKGDETARDARAPAERSTVLDGQGNGSVVTVPANATAATVLDGFTIQNGSGTADDSGWRVGGGIYCDSGSPVISNNIIRANQAGFGAAIACLNKSFAIIENNRIEGNSTTYDSVVKCANYSSVVVRLNQFRLNTSSGVIVAAEGAYGVVAGNVFVENTARLGLVSGSGTRVSIVNNTFALNRAIPLGSVGNTSVFSNNIVAYNDAGMDAFTLQFITFTNNCLWQNRRGDYSSPESDQTGRNGNIKADPRFASLVHGNVHIQPDSPCRDAGSGAVTTVDIDGQPRVQGPRVDIGADESDGSVWPDASLLLHVRPGGNDAWDGGTWQTAKQTLAGALAVAGDGDEVWVAAGDYPEAVTMRAGVALYGGFAGVETARESRDPAAHVSAIVPGDAGTAVSVAAPLLPAAATTVVDGFTITGRRTGSGGAGGVDARGAAVIVAHNVFRSCSGFWGAAVYAEDAPTATVTDNLVTDGTGETCGGIYLRRSPGLIARNTLLRGVSSYTYMGDGQAGAGAIFVLDADVNVEGNTIALNSSAVAGGIYGAGGHIRIARNVIRANKGRYGGVYGVGVELSGNAILANNGASAGGCYVQGGAIVNNTFVANTAADGGAMALASTPNAVTNNIIAFNSSGVLVGASTTGDATLSHNCLFGNGDYDVSGIPDPGTANGNIRTDPELAGLAYGDAHIQPDSPCRDAGDTAAAPDGPDIDGEARVQGSAVDIGADESNGTRWNIQPRILRVRPDGDDAADGLTWQTAMKTPRAALAAVGSAGEVWVAAGAYGGDGTLTPVVSVPPFVHLYGGFEGTETSRADRNWRAHRTILDGGNTGWVAVLTGGYRVSTLDGFTVRNGLGVFGAGIIGDGSAAPVIAHNVITGNAARAPSANNYTGSFGAGVMISGNALLTDNVISGNMAAGGGGLYINGARPVLRNNTITGNSGDPGAILVVPPARGTAAPVTFINNIVAFNTSGIRISTPVPFPNGYQPIPPLFLNNCIYGNGQADVIGTANPSGMNGNLSVNPLLANFPVGDNHLTAASPCVDAGADRPDETESRDIDAEPRLTGAGVDIGADEYSGAIPPASSRIVRVRPDGDDTQDGGTWESARATVQSAVDAVAASGGGEVWVARGQYAGQVTLKPYVYLYGGFAGGETRRDQRVPASNVTVLDGQRQGTVVTLNGLSVFGAVDGFTIQNGKATANGGGISSSLSSAPIANNLIRSNEAARGSAVAFSEGFGVLSDNTITANRVGVAGSIAVLDFSAPLIARNRIALNTGNVPGVYAARSSPMIRNNVFDRNSGAIGGVKAELNSAPTVINNTFVSNTGDTAYGVLAVYNGARMSASNNIIVFNTIGVRGPVSMFNNDVYANTSGNYVGVPDMTGYSGNISADPLFVYTAGRDYHLRPGSPARDSGRDSDVWPGEIDMDGNPRIQGYHVDMGAYEAAFVEPPFPDVVKALRISGGLDSLDPADRDRLNVVNDGDSANRVDIRDALALLRAQ